MIIIPQKCYNKNVEEIQIEEIENLFIFYRSEIYEKTFYQVH